MNSQRKLITDQRPSREKQHFFELFYARRDRNSGVTNAQFLAAWERWVRSIEIKK